MILNKLNHIKNEHEIKNLTEFVTELDLDTQKEMFSFMFEAKNNFDSFLATKIYYSVCELKENYKISPPSQFKKEFTVGNIKNWLSPPKSRNTQEYHHIGFCIKNEEGQNYVFLLATNYLYFGPYNNDFTECYFKEGQKDHRLLANEPLRETLQRSPDNIFHLMNEIEKKKKEFNFYIQPKT